jgi:endonuclease/exonuclease/phosphatase family metal-dependent hydrolase
MFILNRIVFALNGLAILALLLSYAAPYISPELYWPIAFLGLAYPVIIAFNLLFVVYWVAVFKLKFLYSLVAIGLGYTILPSYIQLSPQKMISVEKTINLLDFNMKYFGAFEGKKIQDPDKFFDILDKINPSLLCFQEFRALGTPADKPMYKKLFKQLKNYYTCRITYDEQGKANDGHHQVFFSKFPIIDSGVVEHNEKSDNFTVFIDIVAFDDTIRIVNTHLQSIKFDDKDYTAVKNIKLDNDSSVNAVTNISHKLKIAFVIRAKQAETVRDFIDQSPYKIIVVGDFNDSPSSYAYRTVKGNLNDAFVESGSGLGRTYVGAMPSLRIDYMLHDPSFTSYNYYAKAFEFSDHKMLSCSVKLK